MSDRNENCTHFNGFQNKTCRAGVNYTMLAGRLDGMGVRLPCCAAIRKPDAADAVACDKFTPKSPEEIKAFDDAMKAAFEMMAKIQPWISSVKKQLAQGGQGSGECPICKSKIRFSVARSNHHMRAQCETEDCVNFIE